MRSDNAKKCKSINLGFLQSEYGMTLVEIMVALFILGLVVFALTPLLVGSIARIEYSGDKSQALFETQSEVEANIAREISEEGENVPLEFTFEDPVTGDETVIKIAGGVVESKNTRGEAESWLRGYLPFIPSLNINPSYLVEGYDDVEIRIVINNSTEQTSLENAFNKAITIEEDKEGFVGDSGVDYGYQVCNETGAEEECATFTLPAGDLKNSGSPYMSSIKWDLGNEIEVFVYSRIQVVLPYGAAVGGGQSLQIASSVHETWKTRSHNLDTGVGIFRDITWTGDEYIAVSVNSHIVVWKNRQELVNLESISSSINSIASGAGTHIAVGDSGLVAVNNGDPADDPWVTDIIGSGENLNAVKWCEDINEFLIVGSDGVIYSSPDGDVWTDEGVEPTNHFYGITSDGDNWLVVGKDEQGEAVIYQSDGLGWEENDLSLQLPGLGKLNEVIFDGDNYYAVGDNGTLITFADNGMTWLDLSGEITSDNNLNAIEWITYDDVNKDYVIVGDNGTVITWTGDSGDGWEIQTTGTTSNLYGVALR